MAKRRGEVTARMQSFLTLKVKDDKEVFGEKL